MKNFMAVKTIVFTVILLAAAAYADEKDDIYQNIFAMPERQMTNYRFDGNSSLLSRVTAAPPSLLKVLNEQDGVSNYSVYTPALPEMAVVSNCLELLPPFYKKVLKERLLGIYFISNFRGGGMSDWLFGADGDMYGFIAVNPQTLKHDISWWLTYRENSAYLDGGGGGMSVLIDCGTNYSGFLYVLMHETSHVIDAMTQKTPYVEDYVRWVMKKQGKKLKDTPFVSFVWRRLYYPEAYFDYPQRTNVHFYGFGGGPKLHLAAAADVYRDLAKTPFVSLYGSQSWAEDWADSAFFRYLTGALKQPYVITVLSNNKPVLVLDVMATNRFISNRFEVLDEVLRSDPERR